MVLLLILAPLNTGLVVMEGGCCVDVSLRGFTESAGSISLSAAVGLVWFTFCKCNA